MRNAEDCRKKAEECLLSAKVTPNPEGRQQWHSLSDLWLTVAEQRVSFGKDRSMPALDQDEIKSPVDLVKSRTIDAIGIGDLLRERLTLADKAPGER